MHCKCIHGDRIPPLGKFYCISERLSWKLLNMYTQCNVFMNCGLSTDVHAKVFVCFPFNVLTSLIPFILYLCLPFSQNVWEMAQQQTFQLKEIECGHLHPTCRVVLTYGNRLNSYITNPKTENQKLKTENWKPDNNVVALCVCLRLL